MSHECSLANSTLDARRSLPVSHTYRVLKIYPHWLNRAKKSLIEDVADVASVGEGDDGTSFDVEFFPAIGAGIGAFEQASQCGDVIVGEGDRDCFDGGVEFSQKCGECAGEQARADAFALTVFAHDTHGDAGDFVVWVADKKIDCGDRHVVAGLVLNEQKSLENTRVFDLWGRGIETALGHAGG